MTMNTALKDRIIGITGLIISAILAFIFSDLIIFLVNVGEKYISPDHDIKLTTIMQMKLLIGILITIIAGISLLLLFGYFRKLWASIKNIPTIKEALHFFCSDPICQKKTFSSITLIIGFMSGICLHISCLFFGQPAHEGLLENISSLLFLVAAILLIIAVTLKKRGTFSVANRQKINLFLIVIAGVLLLVFAEEISWGQRIFNWESTGIFETYNYQHETNAHNFFNPLFRFIYPIVGMCSFVVLFIAWFFGNDRRSYLFQLFFSHQSLFFLVFVMACSSFNGHSEIYEELLAIFVLLYSIRIYTCLRFPAAGIQTEANAIGNAS